MAESDTKVGGTLQRLRLEQLEPDALNPRLPLGVHRRHLPPAELYPYVDRAYDALSIANSIIRHGYFEAEPLVAIPKSVAYPDGGEVEPDRYVVVEGNRRLTALKGLADLAIRKTLPSKGWNEFPSRPTLPKDLPVLVVDSREQAAPILGFRHITRPA